MYKLYKQGKITPIGVSNYSPEQMDIFRQVAPLHTFQPPYNLFEREIEKDLFPHCYKNGISTLLYLALCRGLLNGRMKPDTRFTGNDLGKIDPKFKSPRYEQYLKVVEMLDSFTRKNYGKRIIHLAVRWIMDQPGASIALWVARRPKQVEAGDGVKGWSIDKEARETIDTIIIETIKDPVPPEFMAPPSGY